MVEVQVAEQVDYLSNGLVTTSVSASQLVDVDGLDCAVDLVLDQLAQLLQEVILQGVLRKDDIVVVDFESASDQYTLDFCVV